MPSEKPQSLKEFLGVDYQIPDDPSSGSEPRLVDITDPKEFGKAVLNSREFRQYIVSGLTLGNLPGFTSILKFYLEHTCGKSPDKLELTGKDGQPIEQITEVRRVIVEMQTEQIKEYLDNLDEPAERTH